MERAGLGQLHPVTNPAGVADWVVAGALEGDRNVLPGRARFA
ncbi:hypothetical protein ACQP2E_13475 [Actinoplanes sp. CA-015351]